ncbi:MAG TPA: metal ABC transporter permease [Candidatus Krumholzibacteria bacterium]|nr:metal ABC transporter permease [Candidatus Krumholzibacteria bacterium]HPD72476.1 metal ABC transporter permease [Candidatus Krumholzibacteria bacterium]HRY40592.1 metal ABC transporter permease [Candidatus Krumholzibacteria bacterium]
MRDFWQALGEFAFLRHALVAGLVASVACGVVGSFVVTRRISAAAGGLAHAVLGGMGLALWLQGARGVGWVHPLLGALVFALLGALILGRVESRGHERSDTAISALWAVGMALGVIFLFRTPGYKVDLTSYLFGNIMLVDPQALRLLILLDGIVLLVVWLFYHQLVAVCFDPEFTRLRGLNADAWSTLLLVLVALTVVSLIYVVGIVMVIALLSLPAAAVGRFTARLGVMMAAAAGLCAVTTTTGLVLSYRWDLPAGAVTILVAAAFYLAAIGLRLKPLRRRLPGSD